MMSAAELIEARIEALEDELTFYETGRMVLGLSGYTHNKGYSVLEDVIKSIKTDLAITATISKDNPPERMADHEFLFGETYKHRTRIAKEAGLPVYEDE